MSSRITAFLAVILVFFSAGPAMAVGEDVFVVPRVAVQAKADSATAAKRIAQQNGRRQAMDILLRRLTVEDDWPYLPSLATGEPADVGTEPLADPALGPDPWASDEGQSAISITDDMLEDLESGFEVYSEKSSSTTYRAFITYRFKPDAVRKLLKDAQIPYSEAQTRTALVVPVLQTGNGVYLWEENNPWMAAWKVRPYNNELTPMIAPLGDLEDAAAVSARQALAINKEALTTLAERYSVPQVIVAHAYLQQRDGEDRLRVRFINGYRETTGLPAPVGEFADTDDRLAENAIVRGPSTNDFSQAAVGDVLAEAWFSQPSGNFPVLAERAIEETIAKYAKPWKERTLIDHTVAALLNVSAFYNSLGEWAKIRAALTSTPLVGAVQVRSLSRGGAEMLIQAFGDPSKLIVAMEAQGLVLWSTDGEEWSIATPSTASEWQTRGQDRRGIFGARDQGNDPILPASYSAGPSASGGD